MPRVTFCGGGDSRPTQSASMSALPAYEPSDGSIYCANWLDTSVDLDLAAFFYPASQESHDMYHHGSASSPMCIKTESKLTGPDHNQLTPARYSVAQQTSPSVTGSMTSHDSDDPAQIPGYSKHFSTMTEVKSYFADEDVRMLQLQRDDWSTVKKSFHSHCARLFDVLAADPLQAPANFTTFQVQYYQKNQETTLTDVRRSVINDPAHAEARVMVVIDEVLRLHEKGAPLSATIIGKAGSKTGYRLDESLICSERVVKVIEAAHKNKCVAHDILNGKGVKSLVLDPNEYLKRKQENARVNAKKASDRIETKQLISPSTSWSSASNSKRRYGAKGQIHVRSQAGQRRRNVAHDTEEPGSEPVSALDVHALAGLSMQQQPGHQSQQWPPLVHAQNRLMHHVQSAQTLHEGEAHSFDAQEGARKRIKRE